MAATSHRSRHRFARGGAVLIVLAAAVVWGGVAHLRAPRLTPELRGQALAGRLGCFGCHGPGGTGGVANLGSDDGEVPAWDGGTAMMWVKNEQEIREWILYGRPRSHEHHEHDEGEPGAEGRKRHKALLRMPAYEHIVTGRNVDDLVAYYKAVAVFEVSAEVRDGHHTASRLGCFGCHGPGGLVGSSNPRSFKGYIPPWHGKDFGELVKNDDELEAWILDGKIDRFASNPLARFFTGRQVIQMPAYRERLEDGELDALTAYIHWLNDER